MPSNDLPASCAVLHMHTSRGLHSSVSAEQVCWPEGPVQASGPCHSPKVVSSPVGVTAEQEGSRGGQVGKEAGGVRGCEAGPS